MTQGEQQRLIQAAHFELGKVESKEIRHRMVHEIFNHIDHDLAVRAAEGIGVEPPKKFAGKKVKKSAVDISVKHHAKTDSIASRKVAILAADGVNIDQLEGVKHALIKAGAHPTIVSKFQGKLKGSNGEVVEVDQSHVTSASIMFDAVFVPGGKLHIEAQKGQGDVLHFIQEAFKHGKAIGAVGEGVELIASARLGGLEIPAAEQVSENLGVVLDRGASSAGNFAATFIEAIALHRHFERDTRAMVPA